MKHSTRQSALALAMLLLVGTVLADPITVTFEGTISSQFGDPWTQLGFGVGQHFTGQYVFESTTPGNPFATEFGGVPPERMPYPGALLSFTATSGGNTLTSSGSIQNGILVDDSLSSTDDYFVVLASSESELYIDMRSSNFELFTSQALPLTLPPVSAFDDSAFFRIRTGAFAYAQGNLDSVVVVPEPSTWLLLACALLPLACRRRILR